MEWIIYIGAFIVYYLFKAYQQEAQKNVNKPLTPVNKPIQQGKKKSIASPQTKTTPTKKQPQTLEDLWEELKRAANQEGEGMEEYAPERNILDTPTEPQKEIRSIEYEDNLFRSGESIDKVPFEEGASTTAAFIPVPEVKEKVRPAKFIRIKGKKLTPKETFLASIIWEKKAG